MEYLQKASLLSVFKAVFQTLVGDHVARNGHLWNIAPPQVFGKAEYCDIHKKFTMAYIVVVLASCWLHFSFHP